MVSMTVFTRMPEGTEQGVKEILAMHLEGFGQVRIFAIEYTQDGLIIHVQISVPYGSLQTIQKAMVPYMRRFTDTRIKAIKEEFPQQMGFA